MHLVIACNRPGLIRGGIRHPQWAEHDLGRFSPAQLRDMLAEPELTLVVGTRLALGDIDVAEGRDEHAVSRQALDAAVLRLERGLRPRDPVAPVKPVVTTQTHAELGAGHVHLADTTAAAVGTVIDGVGGRGAYADADQVLDPAGMGGGAAVIVDTEGTRRPGVVTDIAGIGVQDVARPPGALPPPSDARPLQEDVNDIAQRSGEVVSEMQVGDAVVVGDAATVHAAADPAPAGLPSRRRARS